MGHEDLLGSYPSRFGDRRSTVVAPTPPNLGFLFVFGGQRKIGKWQKSVSRRATSGQEWDEENEGQNNTTVDHREDDWHFSPKLKAARHSNYTTCDPVIPYDGS